MSLRLVALAAASLAVPIAIFGCRFSAGTPPGEGDDEAEFTLLRQSMVKQQIERRGVKDPKVLAAMLKVKRHLFVPKSQIHNAYDDRPLPIGQGQTISQPYIVAYMTELLKLKGGEKVLEIGTGSGYQAAILAEIAKEVYTIEIVGELAESAAARLSDLGYTNVHVRAGDGYKGWPEAAPFDATMLTAAPTRIPEPLVQQLKTGGRLVLPLGSTFQDLTVVEKTEQGARQESVLPVIFVPMTGEIQHKE